ncbi:MAG: NAD(P)/FAD-dependent oxidoreductase [Acidobacteria bacterium]|nr:NAD(P)/FAD-dependent oxidoreductase [Acidobacteriota bacterium]
MIMRFGVVGARLAGSHLGFLLARSGHEVLLFDGLAEGEKPCGGGVTPKAIDTVDWFAAHDLPHTVIGTLRFITRDGRTSEMNLHRPIHIFSRGVLDQALRNDAIAAGCRFIAQRAVRFQERAGRWAIATADAVHTVDFLVGADGARSTVRSIVASSFEAGDLSLALGYYLPGSHHSNSVVTAFQEPEFKGYLWSFPRVDHSSVGILRWLPDATARDLRRRVDEFVVRHYPAEAGMGRLYAACIPCLSARRLSRQHVCGPTWALVGDAAGFADAITGEGIYYALRSAALLARAIQAGRPCLYERYWREEFGPELVRAAELREGFYSRRLRGRSLAEHAVHLAGSSSKAARLAGEVISGEKSYDRLLWQILLWCPQLLWQALRSRSR